MRLRPLSTLYLRVSLKIESRINAVAREHRRIRRDVTTPISGKLVSRPHPYPGIGHQLAAVVSGYLWARDLGLTFEATQLVADRNRLFQFPSPPDDQRVGRRHRLPSVRDERDPNSLAVLRLACSRKQRGVQPAFELALDQYRWDHSPAAEFVRAAVQAGSYGDALSKAEDAEYIAIHVRRGDISAGELGGASGISRWIPIDWYAELLDSLLKMTSLRSMPIQIISAGSINELEPLKSMCPQRVAIITDGSLEEDFVRLAGATVLFCAPSSFSFSAALASRGVAAAHYPWWHEIPKTGRWVRLHNTFEDLESRLDAALAETHRPDVR